jgi:predicted RNase H-like HicB family nuclease
MSVRFRVIIEQDEDGVFVAEVPSLPGCLAQGETRERAVSNVREAISLYLESLEDHGDPIPPSITEEIVEVEI